MTRMMTLSGLVATLALTGCIEQETIAKVGDAENILFTSKGELLVTGGQSIYRMEITTNASGIKTYKPVRAYAGGDCQFAGIAQHGDWVFTVCAKPYVKWQNLTFKLGIDTQLMAANLTHSGPTTFKRLDIDWASDPLDTLTIPNGLAFTPDGKLLIADENFFGQGSVGRITLDYSGQWPAITQFEKHWAGAEYGIKSSNGVKVTDNTVFISDGGKVRRLFLNDRHELEMTVILADGTLRSNDPQANVFYQGGLVIDDILPVCGGVALTQFIEGKLVYAAANGEVYQTPPLSFESPSSLAIGQGPHFKGDDLLITEKGLLLENNSKLGNRLTRVKLPVDLNDPLTCEALGDLLSKG
ncbi:MAG: hypothetical protein IPM37_01250 [Hahellaceae bacterium]|nr:hypothetical protein [Hahellaceae bacterium]